MRNRLKQTSPGCARILGDAAMDKAKPVLEENEEDVANTGGRGRDGEEVMDTSESGWLSSKAYQVCEGSLRGFFGMKRDTLYSSITMR